MGENVTHVFLHKATKNETQVNINLSFHIVNGIHHTYHAAQIANKHATNMADVQNVCLLS